MKAAGAAAVLAAAAFVAIALAPPAQAGDPSWLGGWTFRVPVTLNTTGATSSNVQVPLVLATQPLVAAGKMVSDCRDLRFTLNANATTLPYWIESGCNTNTTRVWVRVPTLATGSTSLWMYYGNSLAAAASAVNGTFVPNLLHVRGGTCNNGQYCGYMDNHAEAEVVRTFAANHCSKTIDHIGPNNPCGVTGDFFYAWYRWLFVPDVNGSWGWGLDSDDGAETTFNAFDGARGVHEHTVVSSWYGGHAPCGCVTGASSRAMTAGRGVWMDFIFEEWAGGEVGRVYVARPGAGYAQLSASTHAGLIFSRTYPPIEPTFALGVEEVSGPLFADFLVEIPDIVDDPRRLVFRDFSRGGYSDPDQWVWDLGEGTQRLTQNVTHTYAADGTYPVQLVIANPHGQVSDVTKLVHVDSIPPVTTAALTGTLGDAGWYTSAVTVSLAATDERSGVNHTYYRLDGGPVTTYLGAFSVGSDGLHTVEHWSVDVNGNTEAAGSTPFKVDRTPPTALPATLDGPPGANGWYVGDVLASLAASDATSGIRSIQYGIGAAPSTSYGAPVAFAEDGVFLLRWRAIDEAGLVGAERNATIRRDATPPVATWSLAGAAGGGGWYLGSVDATVGASDATSGVAALTASLDGGPAAPVTGPIEVSGHGVHTLAILATDAAGNVDATQSPVVRIDLVAPVSEHHFDGLLGANGIYVSQVNVSFTGNDSGSGIAEHRYSLDGGPETVWTGALQLITNGQHRIVHRAVDVAGNIETVHEVVLTLDLDAPDTTLTLTGTPGANGWFLSDVTANLTVDDYASLDRILYGVDGAGLQLYLTEFLIAGEGVHDVRFHSESIGGLVEDENHESVLIDLSPPTLGPVFTGTAGLAGWWLSPVDVALAATDTASGIVTTLVGIDGAPLSTYTGPVRVGSAGVHTVAGRTTDVAGRQTDLPATEFRLDLADPVTTLTLSPATPDGAAGWYVTAPTLTLAATDVGAGVDAILVSLDGAPEAPYTGPLVLPEGVHTVAYRALDLAGRTETLRTHEIKVDLSAPETTPGLAGTPGGGGWYVSAVTLSLPSTDATSGVAQRYVRVDGGAEQAFTGALALSTTGAHTVAWRVLDVAGNAATGTVAIPVDVSPPVATPTLTPAANAFGWRSATTTFTLAGSDLGSGIAALRYAIDGAPFEDYTGAVAIGEGFHNLSVFATDVAGLVGATTTLPVRVDLTDPTATATFPAPAREDGWFMAPIPVPVSGADGPSGLRDLRYRIDAGAFASAANNSVVDVANEGVHTLRVLARDFADRSSLEASFPFKLDLQPPTTLASLAGTFGGSNRSVAWYRTPVTLSLSSTDAGAGVAAIDLTLDGVAQTYAGPIALPQEGTHTLTFRARDLVDRVEALRTQPAFGVDLSPPETTATLDGALDANDGIYKTPVTLSLVSTDALSGVAANALKVRVGSGTFTTYAGALRFDTSGTYRVEFFATDVAGNLAPTKNETFTVFIDTLPPVTTVTPARAPAEGGWYAAPIAVHLSAVDAQSSVHAILTRVNGGDQVATLGDSADFTFADEGTHTLEYAAIDIAANLELGREAQFRVDLTPPTLVVDASYAEGLGGWIVSPVTLAPAPADALSGVLRVVASVNGAPEQTVQGALTLAQSGFYNVTMRAIDRAGLASAPVLWSGRLDLDAPEPNAVVVGPQGLAGWHKGNVSVLLTAFETMSGVGLLEYRWDNTSWAPYPGSAFQFAQEGLHYLELQATDLAGNLGRGTPIQVGIDRTPPQIQTTIDGAAGEAGWWISAVTATTTVDDLPGTPGVAASGVHNFSRRVDGGPNTSASLPSVVTFATSGVHELQGFALDLALNPRSALLSVPVDLDSPTLSHALDGPEGLAGWFVGPVTLTAASHDPTSGPLPPLLDGAPLGAPVVLDGDGVHALVLNARDVAGRLGADVGLQVPIDATPPDPHETLEGPAGLDGWFHGETTVTLAVTDLTSGPGDIRFRVDGGALQTYVGPFSVSHSGIHLIEWVGLDVAGNAVERTLLVKIDTDLPVAAADLSGVAGNNSWFRSGVNVSLDASDPTSGILAIEYRLDGGAWLPYVGEPITIQTEGRHTLEYRSLDGSGLPSIVYHHEILIDVTTPIVDLHLENTLFVEIDGKVYIRGTLCVEVSGLDALSGLNDLYIRITGVIEELVRIELEVGLQCFELGGGGGGGGGGGCLICAIAGDVAGNEELECIEGVIDPGAPSVDILRPFPGAVSLQDASIPVFTAAFAGSVHLTDTPVSVDVETPEGTQRIGGPTTLAARNDTLARTALVAGTRVPVWVAAEDALSPITRVELHVDGTLVGVANRTQNVTYTNVVLQPKEGNEHEHELQLVEVTIPAYVFEIDTLRMTAGDHLISAIARDAPGNLASVARLVGFVSPAVGNATAETVGAADLPEETSLVEDAIRIAAALHDFLVIDNYAFVDRTVIEELGLYGLVHDLPLPSRAFHTVDARVRPTDLQEVIDMLPTEIPTGGAVR